MNHESEANSIDDVLISHRGLRGRHDLQDILTREIPDTFLLLIELGVLPISSGYSEFQRIKKVERKLQNLYGADLRISAVDERNGYAYFSSGNQKLLLSTNLAIFVEAMENTLDSEELKRNVNKASKIPLKNYLSARLFNSNDLRKYNQAQSDYKSFLDAIKACRDYNRNGTWKKIRPLYQPGETFESFSKMQGKGKRVVEAAWEYRFDRRFTLGSVLIAGYKMGANAVVDIEYGHKKSLVLGNPVIVSSDPKVLYRDIEPMNKGKVIPFPKSNTH